jgi:uncharacterized protein RhaS with RHS repeats
MGSSTFSQGRVSARVPQVTGGITTTYTLDLNAGLTQVLADSSANTYLYGNGRIAQFAGTTPQYFLADHLGSVRQLTNASGAVTLARSYQPYGSMLSSAGTGASKITARREKLARYVIRAARWKITSKGRHATR